MLLDTIKKSPFHDDYVHQNEDTYLVSQKVATNGVMQNVKCAYKVVNPAKDNKDFKSTDFDIANLQEIGAFGMLKPTFLSTLSDMSFADKFQSANITPNE